MAITIDSRQARRPGRTPAASLARVSLSHRAKAFAAAKRHSRLVRLLRMLCPLSAVGVLAAYLAAVGINWQLTAGKFKVGSVEITADDLTMKDPSYFDTTSDGRYEVRAKRAIVSFGQKKDTPIKLVDVSGEMVKKSGEVTKLKAKSGLFDNAKGELELFDGIEIDGSNGLMARLTRAMIYSKEGKVVSADPVSANMPTGSIQAASMVMNIKTKLAQFRGSVSVRLVPQQGQTLGAGKDARRPVDIRAEELDIDDSAKTAHFRGKVVAVQGETMLQTSYLMVKYEGQAAAALGADAETPTARGTGKEDGARVTFLWARNGVEITAGNDRRIISELADFDVVAETALFDGKVVATQERNVLKGGRLSIDRKAGKTRLETPGSGGRISATFHPQGAVAVRPARRPTAAEAVQETVMGSFKTDRSAPMAVEATLLELHDATNKAVFSGNVSARQGDMLLRTSQLTAFYSGKAGLGLSEAGDSHAGTAGKGREKSEVVRLEARQSVIVTSGEQSATAQWADFDVKANKALLGGGVVVDKIVKDAEDPLKRNIVTGDRLRIDLTTGVYQVESDPGAAVAQPPAAAAAKTPATSSGPSASSGTMLEEKFKACPPGRQCGLFFPEKLKQKAIDKLKQRAPGIDVR
jgi:lipopolysaccharide transport protein LptA